MKLCKIDFILKKFADTVVSTTSPLLSLIRLKRRFL